MDVIEFAKIAYAAYGRTVQQKNFRGEPMPSWEDLPVEIHRAWSAAASAVAVATLAATSPSPVKLVAAADVKSCPHCNYIWPPMHAYGRCPGCQQIYDG
jgi:hypothetical protein